MTDPTGAVVPGATVKAINIGTNVEASIRTTSEGNFALLNLIPGQYRLEVAMTGFKGFEQGPIELHVGDTLSIAVTMQLGAQTESVTVTCRGAFAGSRHGGAGPGGNHQTDAESPDAREQRAFYRDVCGEPDYHLADREPLRSIGREKPMFINAAGAVNTQNMTMLDGMPNMIGSQSVANLPTAEMVQEVKVSVAAYDASVGHFTGALVNMVMRTGTNDFHGILTYYHNGTSLNAVPYFTKVSLATDPPVTHAKLRANLPYKVFNRYRGMFTGPVVIPKLYDGHNKTFFMFAGDYFLRPYGGTGTFTIPSLKERTGDFSDLLAIGSNYQIYDPFSAVPTAGGHISRSPVTGNIIPPNRISTVAKNLLNFYPAPNQPGTSRSKQPVRRGEEHPGVERLLVAHRPDAWPEPPPVFLVQPVSRPTLQNANLGAPYAGYGDIYPLASSRTTTKMGGLWMT